MHGQRPARGSTGRRAGRITVWIVENQPDRVGRDQGDHRRRSRQQTGIKVKLVGRRRGPVPAADRASAAAGQAAGRDRRRSRSPPSAAQQQKLLDTDAAAEVVDEPRAGPRSPPRRWSSTQRRRQRSCRSQRRLGADPGLPQGPVRGGAHWPPRRRTTTIEKAAQTLTTRAPVRHHAGHRPGGRLHPADLRGDRAGQQLPAGRRRRQGHLRQPAVRQGPFATSTAARRRQDSPRARRPSTRPGPRTSPARPR